MTTLPAIDELAWLGDVHYGIRCGWFTEDGDMIAVGHHDVMRVVAAMNRHARTTAQLRNLADDRAYDLRDAIKALVYTWAVVLGPCDPGDCPMDAIEAHYCERCDAATNGGHWIETGHDEGAPGAYPVTVWRW